MNINEDAFYVCDKMLYPYILLYLILKDYLF